MNVRIILGLVVLAISVVAIAVWYRRSMAGLRPDDTPTMSGLRLTAEALHRAPSPPWRVVYEIAGALGDIDHVVVGPPGVTAISTLVADRPRPAQLLAGRREAELVAEAAIARGPLDELLRAVDSTCDRLAKVYWGVADPGRPAAEAVVHGCQLVEGQRLAEWLDAMRQQATAPLDQERIDAVWRTIVTGIGRPDPLKGFDAGQ